MPIQCALCGYIDESSVSIIPHIREKHDLKVYLNLFPDLPIVNSKTVYPAIENAVYFGYNDDTPGLADITVAERELVLVSSRNNQHLRSEILITPDF